MNPVDAKFVVADKLPESWRGAARWLVDGRVAGFDLSGVVERAYPGRGFEVGEEVFGAVPPLRGSFADLVAVPPSVAARHETASLTHAEAAALVLPGLTVVQALRQHGVTKPGPRVLVIGASGGVGHLAVQVASARGAQLVVGVCSGRNVDLGPWAPTVLDYEALEPPHDDETGVAPDPLVRRCPRYCQTRRPSFRLGVGHRPRATTRGIGRTGTSRGSDRTRRCSTIRRTPPTSTTT